MRHNPMNNLSEEDNNFELPILFSEEYFSQIANYRSGSKVLVLGEQDFSYSLAVLRILENNGTNIDESVYSKSLDIKSPNDKTKTLLPDIYTPTKTTTTTTTTSYSPPNNSSQASASERRHEESPFSKFKIWGQKN